MPLTVGTRVGPYEIVAPLGAGGMGDVYRALDTRLNRTVAIKMIGANVADLPGARDRFEREARAIAAVEHPNICALYDVGVEGGADFLVMQYVDGKTLADRLERGPMPLHETLTVAQQIAAGLEAAHDHGIVHRDLKPSNIALTADLQVKLVDFGIAKILSAALAGGQTSSPTMTASATEAGAILGTAGYMSPEQARGQVVDKRTDIWSFGCVLFEMLTGRGPFGASTHADTLAAIVGREPDWTTLPPVTPRRLRDLLRRCLQKDPARRLRDIGDARLELEDAASEPADAVVMHPPPPRRFWSAAGWVAAGAALAITVAALFYYRSAATGAEPAMRFSVATNFAGVEAMPALSPDGRQVAFVSNRDGQWDIYVGLVTGGSLVRVTNEPSVEANPRWSPDGTQLLFARLNEAGLYDIWIVPSLSGTARRLVLNGATPAWSPDGRSIAYSSHRGIWICDANGANPRPIAAPEPAPIIHYQPAFAHDGKTIAFVRRRVGPRSELALVEIQTGVVRLLTSDDALALSPVWSVDDKEVYFSSSRGGTVNVWRIAVAGGRAVQITAGQGDDVEIDLSSDGTRLIYSTYRANVNLAEIGIEIGAVGQRRWLTTDAARSESAPRYSPDGRRIAFFSNRGGAEREVVWVMDVDGANTTRVVEDDRTNVFPRWSRDGRELIYYSRASGSLQAEVDLRTIALDGGAPQPLPVKPWFPVWGWGDVDNDGRLFYRITERSGERYDPRTRERVAVADLPGDPDWSPDFRTYAFAVRADAGNASEAGLWIATSATARRQVFAGWIVWFAWTPDGSLLVLEGKPSCKGVMWRVALDGRRTIVLPEVPFLRRPVDGLNWASRFDVHPDGRRIAIEMLESFEADIGRIDNVR